MLGGTGCLGRVGGYAIGQGNSSHRIEVEHDGSGWQPDSRFCNHHKSLTFLQTGGR